MKIVILQTVSLPEGIPNIIIGGFREWGYPKMEGRGKSYKMDDLGVPPFMESLICPYMS